MNLIELSELVNVIFESPPKDISTYNIKSDLEMFPILMEILIRGARKLYGEGIKPSQLTEEQFEMLKKYMLSLSYKIMYNFTENEQGRIINIWFEEVSKMIDCKGNSYYI